MLLILALLTVFVLVMVIKKLIRSKFEGKALPGSPTHQLVNYRAVVPLLVALMMITVAAYLGRSTAPLQFFGLRASGTVTALRFNTAGRRNAYDPMVQFKTPSGDIVQFEGEGSNPPDHRVGEVVTVMYPADHPTHAMIDRGARDWLIPALFGLCAIPIALIGARALTRR